MANSECPCPPGAHNITMMSSIASCASRRRAEATERYIVWSHPWNCGTYLPSLALPVSLKCPILAAIPADLFERTRLFSKRRFRCAWGWSSHCRLPRIAHVSTSPSITFRANDQDDCFYNYRAPLAWCMACCVTLHVQNLLTSILPRNTNFFST